MTTHRLKVRVYYEDTDFSGNVYHAAYLHFFERGRTEFLRDLGVHQFELIHDGIAFCGAQDGDRLHCRRPYRRRA